MYITTHKNETQSQCWKENDNFNIGKVNEVT